MCTVIQPIVRPITISTFVGLGTVYCPRKNCDRHFKSFYANDWEWPTFCMVPEYLNTSTPHTQMLLMLHLLLLCTHTEPTSSPFFLRRATVLLLEPSYCQLHCIRMCAMHHNFFTHLTVLLFARCVQTWSANVGGLVVCFSAHSYI